MTGIGKTILIVLAVLFVTGCNYNNEEELYPDTGQVCDTATATYSKSVLPVLQASCFACHSSADHAGSGGGLDLEDFGSLQSVALGGALHGAISHSAGYSPMPRGGARLDSCSVALIKAWIDKGAPEN